MPSLAELTDAYPQQDSSLPVDQPYRGANLGPLQPVTSASVVDPRWAQFAAPVVEDKREENLPLGPFGTPGLIENNVFTLGDGTMVALNAKTDFIPQPKHASQLSKDAGIKDLDSINNSVGSSGYPVIDKLLGLGGQERYQLWPEKVVRDAISAPHDIIQSNPYPEGSEEASWFEDQRGKNMVPAALNMSALAGTGGLAGTGAELGEALGAGPFLRPALKVGDKIYKAPIKDAENPLGFGAEHSDALPAHLADDFYKKAMSGEDINHYNFGFVNHKGQFLDRSKALDYGIEQGLVDPQNGKYGVLTSTMLADSSKPSTAIEAMAKDKKYKLVPVDYNPFSNEKKK